MSDLNTIATELGNEGQKLIADICSVAWTRLPGSDGEAKAQEFLIQKLKEYGATQVEKRNYHVYSKFFLWWPRISILLFFGSLIFYTFFPLMAFILGVLMILNLAFKIFSFNFLDLLFKKNPSSNVYGKFPASNSSATKKPKRILILGGHTDSNYEYPIGKKMGTGMIKVVIPVVVLMGIWLLGTLIKTILFGLDGTVVGSNDDFTRVFVKPDWFYIFVLICLPYAIWVGFWMVANRPVPGANDNLSGIAVALMTLKYFTKTPGVQLKNVELWAVCFGSEEGGMMGSKAMAKDVKTQLDQGTFPAESVWVLNFDSVGANGPLFIAKSEPMYRAKHNPEVYTQLAESAKNAGVDAIVKTLAAGTDSAPFSRLGIPGVGVVCFGDGHSPQNWHSVDDTPENCDVRGLIHSIATTIQFLKDIDAKLK